MKKKGFTLVELLAVIAILAILVIIALPNVMSLFNEAKTNSFLNECKEIYKTSEQEWMKDSLFVTNEQVYSRCDTCTGKSLKLSGRTQIQYYVKLNKSGKVVKMYVTDGTNQFVYEGNGLLITDITNAQQIAKLNDDDILKIKNNDAFTGSGPSPVSFATDSWETIINAVRNNNTSMYNVGDTKTIALNGFGTHTLRIANKSTPSECSTSGFSQTACGFVIEFADIITTHRMNPYEQNGDVNGDGNRGGWEYSEIRQYVNDTIYNSLPSELKNIIINTFAVSGYGSKDSANFLTTDKIYNFSLIEVGWSATSNSTDSSFSRVLDFYSGKSGNSRIKNLNNQAHVWWLRSVDKRSNMRFWGVRPSDGWIDAFGGTCGVSPAFRIG